MPDPGPLVSTNWLAQNLGLARGKQHADLSRRNDIKVIDASWRMPGAGDARDDFRKRHIAGAQFFDIDEITDKSTDLPHMLPSPGVFANAVGTMGVSNNDHVVVYDDTGIFSAARAWWTFRAFGHNHVSVLDGGLKKWIHDGFPVTDQIEAPCQQNYSATLRPHLLANADDIRSAFGGVKEIIDARPLARFIGELDEPRKGLRRGHMPGAKNLPFTELVCPSGELKIPTAISSLFKSADVDLSKPIVTTCGSGVTAAVLALALETTGRQNWSIYDGSWAEWGDEKNNEVTFPVVTGG